MDQIDQILQGSGCTRLPEKLVQQCADLPETKMGCQLVDLVMDDDTVVEGVWVYGCQAVAAPTGVAIDKIKTIRMHP